MTKEELQHIEKNLKEINVWIETKAALQRSNDTLAPILKAYQNAGFVLSPSCQDCIIDVLIWARKEYKDSLESKAKIKKEDK